MADFYTELSRYYDVIFPAQEAETAFVERELGAARALLDMGCGTGNKTERLAAPGRRLTAFDLDPGMVARARADHARPNIDYLVLDMLDAPARFAGSRYDGVLCLGNTLVHVPDPAALAAFLRGVRGLTADSGVLVTQIVNYDRILEQGVTELPCIERGGVRFVRRYRRRGDLLGFVTELTTPSGETLENDVPLRPLRRAELAADLAAAGFTRVSWYGGYSGEPLARDSFHLIAVARP